MSICGDPSQEHLLKNACSTLECWLVSAKFFSLKNDDWFLNTILKPTTCFGKNCQKCFLQNNANARRACSTKKWPSETHYWRAQVPSFCNGNVEGDKKKERSAPSGPLFSIKNLFFNDVQACGYIFSRVYFFAVFCIFFFFLVVFSPHQNKLGS